ncbi:unnamed protein product [Mytilus coruscus]|uniref:Uncharacterized protein n=1 Tax=Mytilus coruscus TaxID=42192 RepID=A0A6J8AUP0_MYTCO|nr:unnamed protein product [Mytilus coruscus]
MDEKEQKDVILKETQKPEQLSKNETRSKCQKHDAQKDVLYQWEARTFHERDDENPPEYRKKETRSERQINDASEDVVYHWEAGTFHEKEDETPFEYRIQKKETRSERQINDASEDVCTIGKRGTFHEKEDETPFDSSIDYEIDYNDYDFENCRINNYRGPYGNQTLGGFIPPQMNFAKEASSNTSAVPVGPTPHHHHLHLPIRQHNQHFFIFTFIISTTNAICEK